MKTEELRANLTKARDIVDAASDKLWAVAIDLPDDSESKVVRLPVAAATAHDVAATLDAIRGYLLTDENDEERQLSSEELEKICAVIRKHLWFVRDLLGDILYDSAIADSEYKTDLWVLSTAIAEMVDKIKE